jgi:tetratricopeptide (TPR) repeat protein
MKTILAFFLLFNISAKTDWKALKSSIDSRASKAMNPQIHKRMKRAQKYIGSKDYKNAISILEGAITSAKNYPYARASVYQSLGYAYAQSENYKKALPAFRKALEINVLPKHTTLQIMFSLAQLMSMNEDHKNALDLMEGYFIINDKPVPAAHVFVATLYVGIKNKEKALFHVEKAISMDKNPQENWLTFAVWLNYEKKNYKKAAGYLKQLVGIDLKKKNYWTQLAGNLIELNREKEAQAVLELAYKLGLLDQEGEIKNVVALMQVSGMPFQGASLLEKAIKDKKVKANKDSYRMLSQLYIAARENDKALAPLAKAASLSNDGNLYADQGRVYLAREDWKKALEAYNLSFKKGKLKNKGQVHVQKAIALINLKRFKDATDQLNIALKFKNAEDSAKSWISYIQSI